MMRQMLSQAGVAGFEVSLKDFTFLYYQSNAKSKYKVVNAFINVSLKNFTFQLNHNALSRVAVVK